ncbi:MAG: hemolysin family protein [Aphanocapsa lilacina HA4352-LM1]|jgi:putative hemolysin|nr:hemolysin family protein [Aphanocapsa lilacina HA4352-LM1]
MDSLAVQLGLVFLLIAVNAFFAAAEIALVSINRARLQVLIDAGNRRARLVEKLSDDSTRFLATIQVGVTFASFFTSATAAVQLSAPLAALLVPQVGPWGEQLAFFVVTAAVSLLSLILGELVPKRIALGSSEQVALAVAYPIDWLARVSSPLVRSLSGVTDLIVRLSGQNKLPSEVGITLAEIKSTIDLAEESGTVGEQERRIIYGAVALNTRPVRTLMVPRVQLVSISANASIPEARSIAAQSGHTRLPVYVETIDTIIGILHAKDLLALNPEQEATLTVREIARPVQFVPDSKLAGGLLREMQLQRTHLVVVVDEYGGTAGVVTLEDLLEEIVGEIRDEYDAEEETEYERLADGSGIFLARTSIATVNNVLDYELPRDSALTLRGLMEAALERAPREGERIEVDRFELELLPDGQRIAVRALPEPEEEEE